MSETEEEVNEVNIIEAISKIRGDAIGDTLYSERWVLRLLIQLSELSQKSWSTDLEQDLCLLWDMAVEKDVVMFLFNNDFLGIFCKVLRITDVGRCIEIMVGIIGNMCCVEDFRAPLAEHESSIILINLITSEDSLVLVQLLRLLNTCLWKERVEQGTRPSSPVRMNEDEELDSNCQSSIDDNRLSPWLRVILPHKHLLTQHLGFFLSSATNEELLCLTLDLLDTLLKIPALLLPPIVGTLSEIASALAECLRQLLRGVKVADSATNKKLWRGYDVWLSIVGVVASSHEGRLHLGAMGDLLTKCFTKLVLLLTTPEALKSLDTEMAVLCLCVLETLPTVQVSCTTLARLISVLCDLDSVEDSSRQISDESFPVEQLLYRSCQFVKRRMEEAEDLASLIQHLTPVQISFLETIVDGDVPLSEKLDKSILQLRTNGLVQSVHRTVMRVILIYQGEVAHVSIPELNDNRTMLTQVQSSQDTLSDRIFTITMHVVEPLNGLFFLSFATY